MIALTSVASWLVSLLASWRSASLHKSRKQLNAFLPHSFTVFGFWKGKRWSQGSLQERCLLTVCVICINAPLSSYLICMYFIAFLSFCASVRCTNPLHVHFLSGWSCQQPFCLFFFFFFNHFVYMYDFISPAGFDALGDLLKPTIPTHTAPPPPPPQMAIHPGGKLLANDLDSSLANLVGSECPNMRPSVPTKVENKHFTRFRTLLNRFNTWNASNVCISLFISLDCIHVASLTINHPDHQWYYVIG